MIYSGERKITETASTFADPGQAAPGSDRALVAMPDRRVEPATPRIGTLLYLVSVGLVGAATLVASLGIGFYLLVHPTTTIGAGRLSGPGEDQVEAVAVLPGPPAPTSATPAMRSPIDAPDSPNAPAGVAAPTPEEKPSDSEPEPSFSAEAAAAPIPNATPASALPPPTPNQDQAQTVQSGPGNDQIAAVALLPEPSTPVLSTSAVSSPTASSPTAAPGVPGGVEAETPQEGASNSQPEPNFSADAAVLPIPSATSPTALPAPPAVESKTVLPLPTPNEAQPQIAQSVGEEIVSTSPTESSRKLVAGANTAAIEGPQPNHRSALTPGRPMEQSGKPPNGMTVIRGVVTFAPNVATWVVAGHAVRLVGIEPGPPKLLAALVDWVRAKGPVDCVPQPRSEGYRCFTATGEDIAEAALLAGIARVGPHATTAYKSAELQARRVGKGLWGRR